MNTDIQIQAVGPTVALAGTLQIPSSVGDMKPF